MDDPLTWTAKNPTIERTLMVRVISTIWLMLHPGFMDPVHLMAKGTRIPSPGLRSFKTMLSLMVLPHTLPTGILLTTVRACNLPTLHTSLCVYPEHFPSGQNLPTLVTGEFLTPWTPMWTISLWSVFKVM